MVLISSDDIMSLMPQDYIIFTADEKTEILSVSEDIVCLFGCNSKEEFADCCQNRFENLVYEEDKGKDDLIKELKRQIKEDKYSFTYITFRVCKKNGEIRWVEMTGRYTEHKKYGRVCFAYLKDITEVKEKELEHQKEIQKNLLKENIRSLEVVEALSNDYSSVYYIDVKTGQFSIYRMNGNIEKTYGNVYRTSISYKDAMLSYVEGTVIEEDRDILRPYADVKFLLKKLKTHDSTEVIYRGKWNNVVRYFKMKAVPVKKDDKVTAIVAGFADTDAEIKKEMLNRQSLERALQQAKSASNSKTTFLFNMSHDIRTPMNAILGFTSIAKKNIDNVDKVKNCLDKIETSGSHLLRLINDVLDMARIESGKIEIDQAPMNITEVVQQVEAMVCDDIIAKNLNLEVHMDIKDNDVYSDQLRFTQIVINLLSNATKYTKPGGNILYSTIQIPSEKKDYATYEIKVKDTGIGMSKDFLKHVFDAFEREHTTTNCGIQGTGLGLAITKSIVEMFGGTIDVKSELGVGSEFVIIISFRIREDEAEILEEISYKNIDFNGKRILLAEDNELNQEIAYEILTDAGFNVEIASDGAIAVDMLRKSEVGYYDLLLMDIQMPFMDGYKATMEIRNMANKDLASIPIVAMTANAFEEDRRKAIAIGMNGHIAKPIDISALLETLSKILNA